MNLFNNYGKSLIFLESLACCVCGPCVCVALACVPLVRPVVRPMHSLCARFHAPIQVLQPFAHLITLYHLVPSLRASLMGHP